MPPTQGSKQTCATSPPPCCAARSSPQPDNRCRHRRLGGPAKDTARDALRKPAEMMAFARIKPGQKVVELLPGGAYYFTKILSKIVGPTGHVYAASPAPNPTAATDARPPATSLTTDPNYANVSDIVLPGGL